MSTLEKLVPQRGLLRTLVFIGGLTSLGIEMAASRLLAPYFGTSLLIWANLIGLILVYLSVGYWLGGRLADRRPDPGLLFSIVAVAGFLTGLIPFAARPVLQASMQSFFHASVGLFLGSLFGTLALFSLPVILLGMVAPFTIRLALRDVQSAGGEVGALYALSTLGSILGVFLPVLVLIPLVGTRRTFLLLGIVALAVALVGLLSQGRRRPAAFAAAAGVSLLLLEVVAPAGRVRPTEGLLHERESPYHYIQVLETGRDRWLALNEGQALHSWYNPDALFSGGIWDVFTLAPLFRPGSDASRVDSLALIGLAAGTVARQYSAVYGPIPITGVEIDPDVVAVGQTYFAMRLPNLQPVVADGRTWLQRDDGRYDILAVDAYRQPYIPFHLTTVEFFTLTRDHLTDNGVVVVNVGHSDSDLRLVDALAATLATVFPSVFVISPDTAYNSLLVATRRPATLADYADNVTRARHPLLVDIAASVAGRIRPWQGQGLVLTDDHAPVEQITDQIILHYALTGR
jgi:predicted membrane-bound spermidine synthase